MLQDIRKRDKIAMYVVLTFFAFIMLVPLYG